MPKYFIQKWNLCSKKSRKISWLPTSEVGPNSEMALQNYELPTDFFQMAADRNQWRAVFGSKMPSATKEKSTSPRQDIWAELRYGTVQS
jgi:hypothetical protein